MDVLPTVFRMLPPKWQEILLEEGKVNVFWLASYFRHLLGRRVPEWTRKHRVIFIHVPKAAGMAVRQALGIGGDLRHFPVWYYERVLGGLQGRYLVFATVREPVSRFLSAFYFAWGGGYPGRYPDQVFAQWMRKKFRSIVDFIAWMTPARRFLSPYFFPQTFFLYSSEFGGIYPHLFFLRQERLEEDYRALLRWLRHQGVCTVGFASHLPRKNVTKGKKQEFLPDWARKKILMLYQSDVWLYTWVNRWGRSPGEPASSEGELIA